MQCNTPLRPRARLPIVVEHDHTAIRRATRKPILAIGGIAPANAQAIRDAGADGLAVVSAIMAADDPRAAAQALAG